MKRIVLLGLAGAAAISLSGCQWMQNDIAKSSDWITRDINKTFERRRPRTWVSITREGRQALARHVRALRQLLDGVETE